MQQEHVTRCPKTFGEANIERYSDAVFFAGNIIDMYSGAEPFQGLLR